MARTSRGSIFRENVVAYWLLERLGGAAPFPWIIGSGNADRLLSDGPLYERILEGKPHPPTIRTGRPSLDELFQDGKRREENRSALAGEMNLEPDRRWVIVTPPNLAEHRLVSWDVHWRELDYLLSAIRKGLPNYEVLVSLKPGLPLDEYEPFVRKHGAKILRKDLAAALSSADLYISTLSTTTFWALLCGIPCISVDLYGLGYTWLDDVPGVSVVRDRKSFELVLRGFEDGSKRLEEKERARSFSGFLFDGHATERVVSELLSVVGAS